MHVQPKYLPYEPKPNFSPTAGRERPRTVPGNCGAAEGGLRLDELLYTGKENGVIADRFPFPITHADLERGRERYNTSVHSVPRLHRQAGDSLIVQRGFPPPPSFHVDRLRQAPAGHFL